MFSWLQPITGWNVINYETFNTLRFWKDPVTLITESCVLKSTRAPQRANYKSQRSAVFNLRLLSHTQKTVVTLTQSHTPTTTLSQQTHRPTDKHLRQRAHTHTTLCRGRSFHPPGSLSTRPPVCQLCHFSSQTLSTLKWWWRCGGRRDLMTNPLFIIQQNLSDIFILCPF